MGQHSERDEATISGWMVNLVLGSLSKVVGPLYDQILVQTPWSRFKTTPPPNDPTLLISNGRELATLFGRIYELAGKDLYIAFSRHAGREAGRGYLAAVSSRIKPGLAGLQGVPLLQRAAAWHAALYSEQGAAITVSTTDEGSVAVYHNCPECIYLQTDEPICYFMIEATRVILSELTDGRVAVKETACRGLDKEQHCTFELRLR